jgi:hypothetical protein
MGRGYSLRPGISGCSLWLLLCRARSRWHHSPADSADRTSLFFFFAKKSEKQNQKQNPSPLKTPRTLREQESSAQNRGLQGSKTQRHSRPRPEGCRVSSLQADCALRPSSTCHPLTLSTSRPQCLGIALVCCPAYWVKEPAKFPTPTPAPLAEPLGPNMLLPT